MTKEDLKDIAHLVTSDFGFGEYRMCGSAYGDIIEEKIIPLIQSFEHYAADYSESNSPMRQVCLIYWLMLRAFNKGEQSGRKKVADRLVEFAMGRDVS